MLAVAVEELEPDFGVAPDHGQRSPELVGDFGEELGPGAGGVSERLLGAPALADVARGRLQADYFTTLAQYRFREGLEPGVLSGLLADTVGYRDAPCPSSAFSWASARMRPRSSG